MNELPLILALDVAGNPLRWITYQDAAYYYTKNLVAWTNGSSDYTIYGGKRRIDGLRSSLTFNTIVAVKGQINGKAMNRLMVPLTNRTLFRRDRHVCAYCGDSFAQGELTRDHIVPTSQGGKNIWMNVVAACSSCNRRKDAKTPEQARMQLLYVPYAPNRAEYLILQNRQILVDQMEFLLKQVPAHSRIRT